jgi:gamma-glutamylcyclotransferase (GGCT)/AIG2-like uncharacterized protein YtfP
MSKFLFAYGTLQPGLAPADIAPLVAKLEFIGNGFTHGLLYDLGRYAGAILDICSQHTIAGTVFQLPEDPQFLRTLDAFEEYDPAAPEQSPYRRTLCPVVLATGNTLQCWVYAWNGDPAAATVIPDGRFRRTSQDTLSE